MAVTTQAAREQELRASIAEAAERWPTLPPFRLEVEGGDVIPPTHGIAYRKRGDDVCVCYPIPFNVLVALARRLWEWCTWPPIARESAVIRALEQGRREGMRQSLAFEKHAYERGYRDGVLKGRELGAKLLEDYVRFTPGPGILVVTAEERDRILAQCGQAP